MTKKADTREVPKPALTVAREPGTRVGHTLHPLSLGVQNLARLFVLIRACSFSITTHALKIRTVLSSWL